MKPIQSIRNGRKLSSHGDAKGDLISKMGEFCCYCERHLDPQDIHVEHIKPQKSHEKLSKHWSNLLLACSTCNTYKRHYQGSTRQPGIIRTQAWPHLDNTFASIDYVKYGTIRINSRLNSQQVNMVTRTIEMAGLDKTPATAATYAILCSPVGAIPNNPNSSMTASASSGMPASLAAWLINSREIIL